MHRYPLLLFIHTTVRLSVEYMKSLSSVKFDIQELVDAGKLKFDLSLTMLDFLGILKSYSQEA